MRRLTLIPLVLFFMTLMSAMTAIAQQYSIIVDKSILSPGEAFTINITSMEPGETLLLEVVDERGELTNITIVEVLRGDVVQIGNGTYIVTTDEFNITSFKALAPEKPGNYELTLYQVGLIISKVDSIVITVVGETETTPTTITTQVQTTAYTGTSTAVMAVLVIVLIAIIVYYLMSRGLI